MDTLETIFTRRSVRSFTEQPVSEEQIQTLLRAGMQAPSGGNAQPWHFIVITDRHILEAIPAFHTSAAFVPHAPLGILICADKVIAKPGRWILDCSAAAQNILLAAHSLGLGACWVGSEPVQERIDGFRQLFNLPEHIQPVAMIAAGYPERTPAPENRLLVERIHRDCW